METTTRQLSGILHGMAKNNFGYCAPCQYNMGLAGSNLEGCAPGNDCCDSCRSAKPLGLAARPGLFIGLALGLAACWL